jgi:hypothetical protein
MKAIVQLDKSGDVIGRWPSARQCGEDLRRGYEEREFGKGNALMYKKLEKEIKVI